MLEKTTKPLIYHPRWAIVYETDMASKGRILEFHSEQILRVERMRSWGGSGGGGRVKLFIDLKYFSFSENRNNWKFIHRSTSNPNIDFQQKVSLNVIALQAFSCTRYTLCRTEICSNKKSRKEIKEKALLTIEWKAFWFSSRMKRVFRCSNDGGDCLCI